MVFLPIVGISDNFIRSIIETKDGTIWIGTENGDLNHFNTANESFTRFQYRLGDPLDPSSISHSEVYAMMEDQGKRMWFGTFDGPKRLNVGKFENLFHEIDLLTQKNNENYVLSVIQGQTGDYWIGTDGGGINNVYPGSTQIQHYKHNPGATPTA